MLSDSTTNLLPLRPCSDEANDSLGYACALRDNRGVVDEFVCAEFQQEEGRDEDGNIVYNDIGIGHGEHGKYETIRVSIRKTRL
jgi:hypothetical protein